MWRPVVHKWNNCFLSLKIVFFHFSSGANGARPLAEPLHLVLPNATKSPAQLRGSFFIRFHFHSSYMIYFMYNYHKNVVFRLLYNYSPPEQLQHALYWEVLESHAESWSSNTGSTNDAEWRNFWCSRSTKIKLMKLQLWCNSSMSYNLEEWHQDGTTEQ